jgi:hypothetical protein
MDVEGQRASTGLGQLLVRPLLDSRLDAGRTGVSALAVEFLPYAGNFDD